jgi:hypothetical protein
LRQREWQPRRPEASGGWHGGQIDVPEVVGILGADARPAGIVSTGQRGAGAGGWWRRRPMVVAPKWRPARAKI